MGPRVFALAMQSRVIASRELMLSLCSRKNLALQDYIRRTSFLGEGWSLAKRTESRSGQKSPQKAGVSRAKARVSRQREKPGETWNFEAVRRTESRGGESIGSMCGRKSHPAPSRCPGYALAVYSLCNFESFGATSLCHRSALAMQS